MKTVPTAFFILGRDDKEMKKEERRYDRKEYGTAGKLIGLIYERSPVEYMMTSAEFTNEELKTLQAMLENHTDEGITIIGKKKELNIDALYEKSEPEKESGGIEVPLEKLQEGWLSEDAVNKIVALSQKYSEFYDKEQKAEGQLREQIYQYLNKNNLWKNPKAILEVISYLPPCYLRFNMYETYYELVDAEKNKTKNGKRKKNRGDCR